MKSIVFIIKYVREHKQGFAKIEPQMQSITERLAYLESRLYGAHSAPVAAEPAEISEEELYEDWKRQGLTDVQINFLRSKDIKTREDALAIYLAANDKNGAAKVKQVKPPQREIPTNPQSYGLPDYVPQVELDSSAPSDDEFEAKLRKTLKT